MVSSSSYQSALSTRHRLADALEEVAGRLSGGSSGVDLAVVFASHEYAADWDDLARRVQERLPARLVLGCGTDGAIGCRQEVEEGPVLSVWTARLPGAHFSPIALGFERTPEGGAITGWSDELIEAWPDHATLLMLADPFTFPADYLLQRLNEDHPDTCIVGGMSSGAPAPGKSRLFLNDQTLASGAVGFLLHGDVSVRTVVSQGCRPIGEPMIVTQVERNIVHQLSGRPAVEVLQEVFDRLPNQEKQLVQRGLHLGVVMSEYRPSFGMGDFLIRNVLGLDQASQAIAVGDYLRRGQTVQFHLRDERTASEELRALLQKASRERAPQGALLFTCNGRGTRLFSQPHHDASVVADVAGDIPLAGYFAQGEIGPVAGRNFLHGFTASVALFD